MCRQLITLKNNSKWENGTIRALKLYRGVVIYDKK